MTFHTLVDRFTTLATFAFALTASACTSSSDAGTTARSEDYDQVAGAIGGTAAATGDGAPLGIATTLAAGTMPLGLVADAGGHIHGDRLGLTYDVSVDCRDSTWQPLATCAGSAGAIVTSTWSGALALPRLAIDADGTATWTVHGLLEPVATVDGDAHAQLASTFASASDQNHKALTLTYDATYDALAIDRASSTIVGGSIAFTVHGTRTHVTPGLDASTSFAIDGTITFAADGTGTLVLDGDHAYTIAAHTGVVTPRP